VIGGACSLATTPVNALELGEVQIESTLGQPLRASIAYALNPNEQLFDFCISLRPGVAGSAIPTVSRARISVTAGAIILTGKTSIRDPLLNVQVAVDCPYTPHLVREYTLIVDPALRDVTTRFAAEDGVIDQPLALPAPATPQETAIPRVNTPARASRLRTDAPPIAMSAEYQVQPGDTISLIASRIENRTIGLMHS
jgi:Tfp pilus assembly protein FimV